MKISTAKQIWGYVRVYKWQFFTATVLRASSDAANLIPIWAFSRIVLILTTDFTVKFTSEIYSDLVPIFVIWLLSAIYRPISKSIAKYLAYRIAEDVALDAKQEGLAHIYDLDLNWQERENSGNKLKRINHGSNGLNDMVRTYIGVLIEASVNTIGVTAILWTVSWKVSLVLAVFMITYYLLSLKLTSRAVVHSEIVNKKEEDLEGISFESLNNIRTVKSLGLSENINQMVASYISKVRKAVHLRIFWFRIRGLLTSLYYRLFELVSIAFIVLGVVESRFDVAFLVLYLGYFYRIGEAADELSEATNNIVISGIYIDRLNDILKTKPTIEKRIGQLDYPKEWQDISMENLNFGYDEETTLRDINLKITRGERIGIVGLSGAGKSTLFRLLLDLYEDYSGEILVGGRSLRGIDRQKYINNVATVLQETELFNATLAENIEIAGVQGAVKNQERLARAVEIAHLGDVVDKLSDGLETVIGEKGVKLSGGERQRVGIARAVYRQPDILLLDEATSHLDVDSEQKIQESLHDFFQEVTAIVIAHRLTTIKEMDRIIVMSGGQIVEQGTFDELLGINGHFKFLWSKMNKGSD